MDSEHNSEQVSHRMPTIEETKKWDVNEMLDWIQKQKPKVLPDDKVERFKKADIAGRAFLTLAGNSKFFQDEFDLSIGNSLALADLAREIKEGETAGIKSKFTIFIHAHYKLTTSQETDSRPKMWRCPTPPITLVSPLTTHLCCSLYANPYYCRAFNSHII
jgi:hypothetical protein